MAADHVTPSDARDNLSRREFMVRSALVAGTVSLGGRAADTLGAVPAIARADAASTIVQTRSDEVINPRGLHQGVLLDLLHLLLQRLTDLEPAQAWRSILRPDDVIGLKFNRSGADGLATTDVMVRVLVQSLTAAGFKPEQLVAIEVSPAIRAELGVLAPVDGWNAQEVDFGSGKDQLAAWLDQVTAIINIPFLKTHNFAGMTGSLKNLSHAVIKHPAQFHANGCSPYIGDIVALPAVRTKLRLHLLNALRVVFEGGPSAVEENIWDAGVLAGGFDPVALDCVGLQLIDRVRGALHLPGIGETSGPPAYLAAAAARGLGTDRLHMIRLIQAKL